MSGGWFRDERGRETRRRMFLNFKWLITLTALNQSERTILMSHIFDSLFMNQNTTSFYYIIFKTFIFIFISLFNQVDFFTSGRLNTISRNLFAILPNYNFQLNSYAVGIWQKSFSNQILLKIINTNFQFFLAIICNSDFCRNHILIMN